MSTNDTLASSVWRIMPDYYVTLGENMFCAFYMRAVSHKMFMNLIYSMLSEIILLNFLTHLQEAHELMDEVCWNKT